VFDLNQVSCLS